MVKVHRIIRNSAKCKKCEEEIESTHSHDFRSCLCGAISVDGGKDYIRRLYESRDICVETSTFEAYERAEWSWERDARLKKRRRKYAEKRGEALRSLETPHERR